MGSSNKVKDGRQYRKNSWDENENDSNRARNFTKSCLQDDECLRTNEEKLLDNTEYSPMREETNESEDVDVIEEQKNFDDIVAFLTDMGYQMEAAQNALMMCGGIQDDAVSLLINQN